MSIHSIKACVSFARAYNVTRSATWKINFHRSWYGNCWKLMNGFCYCCSGRETGGSAPRLWWIKIELVSVAVLLSSTSVTVETEQGRERPFRTTVWTQLSTYRRAHVDIGNFHDVISTHYRGGSLVCDWLEAFSINQLSEKLEKHAEIKQWINRWREKTQKGNSNWKCKDFKLNSKGRKLKSKSNQRKFNGSSEIREESERRRLGKAERERSEKYRNNHKWGKEGHGKLKLSSSLRDGNLQPEASSTCKL